MTKRAKQGKELKDLDPKSRGKEVKGGKSNLTSRTGTAGGRVVRNVNRAVDRLAGPEAIEDATP